MGDIELRKFKKLRRVEGNIIKEIIKEKGIMVKDLNNHLKIKETIKKHLTKILKSNKEDSSMNIKGMKE